MGRFNLRGRISIVLTTAWVCAAAPDLAASQTTAGQSADRNRTSDTREQPERPTLRTRRASSPGLISDKERVGWFTETTVGPGALAIAASGAAWGTMRRDPNYGTGAAAFGKHYAMRMGDTAVKNGLEVSLGALWHEDPRYVRSGAGQSGSARVAHALRLSVMTPRPGGRLAPSYARYTALVGGGFIANAWRPRDERSVGDALTRSASNLAGAVAGNMFVEFWPDIRRAMSQHLLRRPARDTVTVSPR